MCSTKNQLPLVVGRLSTKLILTYLGTTGWNISKTTRNLVFESHESDIETTRTHWKVKGNPQSIQV